MATRPNHPGVANRHWSNRSHGRFVTAILATSEVVLVLAMVTFLLVIAIHESLRHRNLRPSIERAPAMLRNQNDQADSQRGEV
jgi:hypothetical protein